MKRSFVCVLMLLALLLQGQVQAAGMRCSPAQGRAGAVAMASGMDGHQAHAATRNTPMAHHDHAAHAEAAGTMVSPEPQDSAGTSVHAPASGHADCGQLAACCHGAALPAPLVALVASQAALSMPPHPAKRPPMALIARLERPPIPSLR